MVLVQQLTCNEFKKNNGKKNSTKTERGFSKKKKKPLLVLITLNIQQQITIRLCLNDFFNNEFHNNHNDYMNYHFKKIHGTLLLHSVSNNGGLSNFNLVKLSSPNYP